MTESVLISTANFTKIIGQLKSFPFNLFDTFKGAIYTPWDKSTLFQDSAMTQPVTAVDQKVYVIKDMSGNGFHWIANSEAARPVYKEVNGKGVVRFTAAATGKIASHGMTMAPAGLSIFSGVSSAIVINALNLAGINPSWRFAFRINVQSGNTQLMSIDTTNGTGKIGLTYKRVHADAIQSSLYSFANKKEVYTFDADYIAGTMKTYKDQSELNSQNLASTGALPSGNNNGIYLGNFNSTGYATMDFHGGIMLAGASSLNQYRIELEDWLIDHI